jgi:AraC-like DNA-binding protein
MYLKTNQYDQFDSLEVKESRFKEFNLPSHFHDSYCIGLLANGIKNCTIENNSQLIHSNSVSIINPYQIHTDKNIDYEDCLFRMIYLNKDVLNYFTKKITGKNNENIIFTNEIITNSFVNSSITSFFDENNKGILLEQKLENLIQILLNNKYSVDTIKISIDNKNAIDDCIEKVRLNFFDKIDITKMSQESKISKYQLIRYFKKKTGFTPASYILLHRINHSKKLLIRDISIGEIALEVGFYDHAQFCKFFKYYTNVSPTEYRQNCNIIQAY